MQFLKKLFGTDKPDQVGLQTALEKSNVAVVDVIDVPASGISLVKKFENEAPQLVNLAKRASISLEKKNLTTVKANVVVVLDASGSMSWQYRNGTVQEVLNRVLPLAIHFDIDGILDCWAFASSMKQLDQIKLSNIDGYLNRIGLKSYGSDIGIGGDNNEPVVIKDIMNTHRNSGTTLPTYVVFITDGGITRSDEIESLLKDASKDGIFWQFVGIGGSSYGVLEHFDDMTGRVVDNCDFFSLRELKDISDSELYDKLLNEFPHWINSATSKGIL